MKGNNIDDLFRNGLGSHKITPPSTAWDKVESQLPTKSKKGIYFWISIAASIILIFTFGWIILSDSEVQQTKDQNFQAKDDATQVEENPAATPETITSAIPDKQLVAQVPTKVSTPSAPIIEAPKTPITSELDNVDQLQAKSEPVEELFEEKLSIELILIDINALPSFYNAKSTSNNSLEMDIAINMESYISSYQILTLEPTKKKKFSILSGIVNVAKGVNSGKLALSEMRKSKNDFFNNDLKYGSKEGDPEEAKGDIDEN